MKNKEELNALKNEVKTLNAKLAELTEDELKEVTGGAFPEIPEMTGDYTPVWHSESTEIEGPTSVGEYNAVFTPKDKENYDWSK